LTKADVDDCVSQQHEKIYFTPDFGGVGRCSADGIHGERDGGCDVAQASQEASSSSQAP
jgi:hypothetical protein